MTLPALQNTTVLFRRILSQFPQDISLAFAYGSGVFKQQGTTQGQMGVRHNKLIHFTHACHLISHALSFVNVNTHQYNILLNKSPLPLCIYILNNADMWKLLNKTKKINFLYTLHYISFVWYADGIVIFIFSPMLTHEMCNCFRKTCWTLCLLWTTRSPGTQWTWCRIEGIILSWNTSGPSRSAPSRMSTELGCITTP